MKNILVFIIVIVFFLVNIVANALLWAINLPKDFWEAQKTAFQAYLSKLPEEIREKIKAYDCHGLRHNAAYLAKPDTRNMVAALPIEKQAEYVDIATKNFLDQLSKGAGVNTELIIDQFQNIDMTLVNATDIGNIAYWALHSQNIAIKNEAFTALMSIQNYFSQFQKSHP